MPGGNVGCIWCGADIHIVRQEGAKFEGRTTRVGPDGEAQVWKIQGTFQGDDHPTGIYKSEDYTKSFGNFIVKLDGKRSTAEGTWVGFDPDLACLAYGKYK